MREYRVGVREVGWVCLESPWRRFRRDLCILGFVLAFSLVCRTTFVDINHAIRGLFKHVRMHDEAIIIGSSGHSKTRQLHCLIEEVRKFVKQRFSLFLNLSPLRNLLMPKRVTQIPSQERCFSTEPLIYTFLLKLDIWVTRNCANSNKASTKPDERKDSEDSVNIIKWGTKRGVRETRQKAAD